MNHNTNETAVARSNVIAWGRASFESLKFISYSPVKRRILGRILKVAINNAQPSEDVPGHRLDPTMSFPQRRKDSKKKSCKHRHSAYFFASLRLCAFAGNHFLS